MRSVPEARVAQQSESDGAVGGVPSESGGPGSATKPAGGPGRLGGGINSTSNHASTNELRPSMTAAGVGLLPAMRTDSGSNPAVDQLPQHAQQQGEGGLRGGGEEALEAPSSPMQTVSAVMMEAATPTQEAGTPMNEEAG